MPSPFPGMDPYLESPHLWPGVHHRFITSAAAELNKNLPGNYVADIDERVYVEQHDRTIYPDLSVFEKPPVVREGRVSGPAVADPPFIVEILDDEIHEGYIKILPVGDEKRVVTVIEVLSPANKSPGRGRESYLEKQAELLASETHLLEVDLLRNGVHTIAIAVDALKRKGRKEYAVCLHRTRGLRRFEVWTVSLRQRLPRVLVPLLPADPDVVLDLQRVFERCYDEGPYTKRIDYSNPPVVGLSSDDMAWAESIARTIT